MMETRTVEIEGKEYDVDSERAAAQQALLDAGLHEVRVYCDGCATVTVLRDSGMLHASEVAS